MLKRLAERNDVRVFLMKVEKIHRMRRLVAIEHAFFNDLHPIPI